MITARYSNGTTQTIAYADVTITGFDTNTVGNKYFNVYYNGLEAQLDYVVVENEKMNNDTVDTNHDNYVDEHKSDTKVETSDRTSIMVFVVLMGLSLSMICMYRKKND